MTMLSAKRVFDISFPVIRVPFSCQSSDFIIYCSSAAKSFDKQRYNIALRSPFFHGYSEGSIEEQYFRAAILMTVANLRILDVSPPRSASARSIVFVRTVKSFLIPFLSSVFL
ncbi:hypothetical protein KIN20_017771 [Parelaphostrongylus tenuis]|uniref:Uncharacterized protein n=1 Tax=Parelaphostrongylus tenuis TaxID=148309 RepID=A0AAD5QRQ8_PARTN|nr:hypothetical protein KIN20_017771 [Parelaphostrongylus tenuis]